MQFATVFTERYTDHCALQETELEYRQARYLQRQEQKRERQALIARVEALNHGMEHERRLFEAERVKLQALLDNREVKLRRALWSPS